MMYANYIFVDLGEKAVQPPYALGPWEMTVFERYQVADSKQVSDSCTIETLSAYDSSCHFRFSRYTVKKNVSLLSIPNRPVLTLNIQLEGNIDFQFGEHFPGESLAGECKLFWQGNQTLVQNLIPGEYVSLDIFFEDTMVPGLKINGKKFHFWEADLLDTPLSTTYYSAELAEETSAHIRDMVERIQTRSFSGMDFFSSCVNLLTYYFKGKRKRSRNSLERILYYFPFKSLEKDWDESNKDRYYKETLERMRNMDRARLEERFLYLREKVVSRLDHIDWIDSIARSVLDPYLLLPEPEPRDALLNFYYGTAKLLADRLETERFSSKDRDWVRICIFTLFSAACDVATPTESQIRFIRSLGPSEQGEGISDTVYQELIKKLAKDPEFLKYSKPNILTHVTSCKADKICEAKVCPVRQPDTVRIYARLRAGLEKYSILFRREWHKIEQQMNQAYMEDDTNELLLLEIRYLTKLPGYLQKVDTDTLCWYQIVLKTELNEQRNASPRLTQRPVFPVIDLHVMLEQWKVSFLFGFRPRGTTMYQVLDNLQRVCTHVLLSGNRAILYSFCGMVSRSYWK